MKTSDFRIGNIIQIPGWGGYREITSLSESTFQASSQSIHISKIIPIPLTKELLTEWLGFDEDSSTNPCKPERLFGPSIPADVTFGHSLTYEEGTGVVVEDFEGGFSGYPAKYLHQLQNLYFALTGTELEIKIPAKA